MVDLLDAVATSTSAARASRASAAQDALRAARALEASVVAALAGDPLRGLSDLVPGDGPHYYAAHVGSTKRYGVDSLLPADGREVLVITRRGYLARARIRAPGETSLTGERWAERPVDDTEIRAADLPAIAEAYQIALARHVDRTERVAATYDAVSALARRLAQVVDHPRF